MTFEAVMSHFEKLQRVCSLKPPLEQWMVQSSEIFSWLKDQRDFHKAVWASLCLQTKWASKGRNNRNYNCCCCCFNTNYCHAGIVGRMELAAGLICCSKEQQGIKDSNFQPFGHKSASAKRQIHTFCSFLISDLSNTSRWLFTSWIRT